ncbi:putative arylsulfatase regulatory protein [Prochlorococcus sp. MIT 0703]|nr:putative arylsulfatase regulatory protein [Prochlorococcus sp. MIT 0703]
MISMTTASPNISRFGPIGLVVIQSTSLCNLDCSYCYLPDRKSRKIFDLELLPLLMQRIFESPFFGEELSLVWHAGEPLTLPCSYYDKATQLINEAVEKWTNGTVHVEQHVQTNATLINDAWCECFRRNQINVGISVDGPKDIHDANRCFRNGEGSHVHSMRGIEALKRNKIPFHAIAVVTATAMDDPNGMYQFFRDNEIRSVGFNVEEQEGEHTSSSMQGYEREEQYRQFLQTFWQLSEQDGFPIVLREFDQVISLIREDRRLNQNELNRPYSILSVDWQGNFSTFDPELLSVSSKLYGTFDLGSIRTISLMEAAKTERFKTLWSDMLSGVKRCEKECNYFGFCGGGMGSNKFWEHGSLNSSETNACRFNSKIPVDVLLDRFKSGPPIDN